MKFTLLVVVVVLAVLSSLLLSSSYSSIQIVEAKKEIYKTPPINDAIPHIRCYVCEHLMFQIVRNTLDYIAEVTAKKKYFVKLKEEKLIDYILEPICIPYTTSGAWLRSSTWDLVNFSISNPFKDEDYDEYGNEKDKKVPMTIHYKLLDDRNYRCGERCSTAATACDNLLMGSDSEATDKITSILIQSFNTLLKHQEQESTSDDEKEGAVDEKEVVEIARKLIKSVCKGKYANCAKKILGKTTSTDKKKNKKQKILKKSILNAPKPIPMDSKEIDVEEMMYRMKHGLKKGSEGDDDSNSKDSAESAGSRSDKAGNPGVDVYSRDEMMQMREAMVSGNREKLREVDPTSDDLSEEEFEILSKMHQKEFDKKKKNKNQQKVSGSDL